MVFAQLHLNIGVSRAHRRRGGVGEIERGVGQADVVEDRDEFFCGNLLADCSFDVVAEVGGLLDARAGVGAHMDHELAGVNGREEILTEERQSSPARGRQMPKK